MTAWTLVALALFLLPPRTIDRERVDSEPVDSGRVDSGRVDRDGAVSTPKLLGVAAVLGAASLLVFGLAVGALVALIVVPLGFVAVRRIPHPAASVSDDAPGVPLVLDLTAAALRAGRPLADALAAAAPAAPGAVQQLFERVAALLRLGMAPVHAWAVMPPGGALASVTAVAVRSADSGARLANAFERLATELRADAASAAAARAQRAGVVAMAPLGACFLPAFVLLGVVPTVVGIARTIFGGLP